MAQVSIMFDCILGLLHSYLWGAEISIDTSVKYFTILTMVRLRSQKDTESTNSNHDGDVQMQSEMATDSKSQETHLITGAGGHAGFWLGKRLASRGHKVILVDVKKPVWELKHGMEFQMVSILNVFFSRIE